MAAINANAWEPGHNISSAGIRQRGDRPKVRPHDSGIYLSRGTDLGSVPTALATTSAGGLTLGLSWLGLKSPANGGILN